MMNDEQIARLCHEVNRAYCFAMGDSSQLPWDEAPEWQRASAVDGVRFHKANQFATPDSSHERWRANKEREGWVYGAVKDAEKKEHPCMVPFHDLPPEQQAKDHIFAAIVRNVVWAE